MQKKNPFLNNIPSVFQTSRGNIAAAGAVLNTVVCHPGYNQTLSCSTNSNTLLFDCFSAGFNSLVGGVMGFSILISAEVFKHNPEVWYLDGAIGVLIGLTILAYGIK